MQVHRDHDQRAGRDLDDERAVLRFSGTGPHGVSEL
jgi:hypothetical protein